MNNSALRIKFTVLQYGASQRGLNSQGYNHIHYTSNGLLHYFGNHILAFCFLPFKFGLFPDRLLFFIFLQFLSASFLVFFSLINPTRPPLNFFSSFNLQFSFTLTLCFFILFFECHFMRICENFLEGNYFKRSKKKIFTESKSPEKNFAA